MLSSGLWAYLVVSTMSAMVLCSEPSSGAFADLCSVELTALQCPAQLCGAVAEAEALGKALPYKAVDPGVPQALNAHVLPSQCQHDAVSHTW